MCLITHESGDFRQEGEYAEEEEQRHTANHHHHSGIDRFGLRPFLIDKPEERRFHSKSKDDKDKSDIGINIGYDAITAACSRKNACIERYEQIIKESADNAAQAVDRSIL